MKRIIGVVAAGVVLIGCGTPSGEQLIGSWERTDGVVWEVDDNSITASFEGDSTEIESTYTANDTTLEIVDVSGGSACPSDAVGTYEWEIANDSLSLTVVEDDCAGRGEALSALPFERSE